MNHTTGDQCGGGADQRKAARETCEAAIRDSDLSRWRQITDAENALQSIEYIGKDILVDAYSAFGHAAVHNQ